MTRAASRRNEPGSMEIQCYHYRRAPVARVDSQRRSLPACRRLGTPFLRTSAAAIRGSNTGQGSRWPRRWRGSGTALQAARTSLYCGASIGNPPSVLALIGSAPGVSPMDVDFDTALTIGGRGAR